ncbi:MAG: DUF4878 domain-containing protein [Chitinophagaceae bacterium]|nr:MAG: DUF4878 domain-containing protein [Chitinophagaceae bacterium]
MKKLFVFIFAIGLLSACGGGAKSPEDVAEKFLNHLGKLEFSDAKKYGTKETKELLDLLEGFAGMGGEEAPDTPDVENVNCTESGDTADCTYCCDENGNEASVKMKKVDGKWLVHMSKEEAFGDMGGDDDWDDWEDDWEMDWDDEELEY